MLLKLKEELLKIEEIRNYTGGNIYTIYLDDWSVFPCITLYFIASKFKEGIESISLQVKIWTLNIENPEKELLEVYDVLYKFFEARKEIEYKTLKLFLKYPEDEFDESDEFVKKIPVPPEERILQEKINDIEVYSLPLILSAKGIIEEGVEAVEKVSEAVI